MRIYTITTMCVAHYYTLYNTLKATVSLLSLLVASVTLVSAQSDADNDTQLACVPFGICEPCPESAVRASKFNAKI